MTIETGMDEIAMLYAGPAAERRFRGRWGTRESMANDLTAARAAAERLYVNPAEVEKLLAYMKARAAFDVERAWRYVDAVAWGLLQRETLAGAELEVRLNRPWAVTA